ncbi:MAG: hypothetical protein PHS82_06350 [Lachnospiraceae bacterium]|nr:hypothetical protein [Lachnospiraceae bacterium]
MRSRKSIHKILDIVTDIQEYGENISVDFQGERIWVWMYSGHESKVLWNMFANANRESDLDLMIGKLKESRKEVKYAKRMTPEAATSRVR